MIRTERLHLRPASDDEMKAIIASQSNEILKQAYTEMLSGCLEHPDQRVWYAVWMMELEDGTCVGTLCFKGLDEDGIVELGYGVEPSYEGRGYATEAVSAIAKWASTQEGVKRVEAETEPSNVASQRVLAKSGFVSSGVMGEEGPRFVWVKTQI